MVSYFGIIIVTHTFLWLNLYLRSGLESELCYFDWRQNILYLTCHSGKGLGYLSGITLGYGLDDRGFDSRRGLGIFLFTTASRPVLGPIQPPIQWVQGFLSLGVKRRGREADHSPPSSAEVKNPWSYSSTPPIRLHAQGQLYLCHSGKKFCNELWKSNDALWGGNDLVQKSLP
jgi:hypothetical protein